MEDTPSDNKPETLPPPPPPPLPAATPSGLVSPPIASLPNNNGPFPISSFMFRRNEQPCYETPQPVVTCFKNIQPVLQEGPCCGIVALSMASQYFPSKYCTAQEILNAAKSLQFTKNGEMFSASNMASLAECVLGCKATVLSGLLNHKRNIISYICQEYPVLLPYDADKNHHPCLSNGRNAHWALLNGACLELSKDVSNTEFESQLISGKDMEKYLDSSIHTHVFARQGKSRHMALWDFETLLSSNKNLFEVTTKYCSENMVLPYGDDVMRELRDKAVVLSKRK